MSQSATARNIIETAFHRFEQTISSDRAAEFRSTDIASVRQAALDIEKWQRERGSMRNMRRIEPLLTAIQQYAGPLETLCQGTPFLPFVWVSKGRHLALGLC